MASPPALLGLPGGLKRPSGSPQLLKNGIFRVSDLGLDDPVKGRVKEPAGQRDFVFKFELHRAAHGCGFFPTIFYRWV
jgi:hypothetical protein